MYPVSEKYIRQIMSSSVTASWYGRIHTETEKEYILQERNIDLSNSRFIHEAVSSNSLQIGTAYARQLDLKLYLQYDPDTSVYTLNGTEVDRYEFFNAEIKLWFRLYFSKNKMEYEDVPIGTFIVADAERSTDTLTLSSYDYMYKFDKPFEAQSVGKPYDWINYACEVCGIELGLTEEEIEALPNGKLDIFPFEPARYVKTWQNMISYIAQLLCSNAFIAHDDKLYFKMYGMEVTRSISSKWRYSSKLADYETHYSEMTEEDADTKSEIKVKVRDDTNGLTYKLGLNPFLQFGLVDDKKRNVQNILDALNTVFYTPFEVKVPIDPALTVMDVLEFTDLQAVTGKCAAIMSIEYSLNGSMTIKSVGDNPFLIARTTGIDKEMQSIVETLNEKTVYYYDFVNVEEINIADTKKATIIDIRYATSRDSTHVDFHAELTYTLTLTDPEVAAILKVSYYINNEEVVEYHPMTQEMDGIHLLHLLYVFYAPPSERGTFKAVLTVTGGSIHIDEGSSRGYIAGQGLATREGLVKDIEVSDTFPGYLISTNDIVVKDFMDEASVYAAVPDYPVGYAEAFSQIRLNSNHIQFDEPNIHITVDFDIP